MLPYLDRDQPVYALQARGLARPQAWPGSVAEMAADYVAQLRTVQPHGPYHLLGWSSGGAVAHAMAGRLRDQGEQVALLALLDSSPPGPDYQAPDAGLLVQVLHEMGFDAASGGDEPVDFGRLRDFLRDAEHPLAGLEERSLRALYEVHGHQTALLREPFSGVVDTSVLFFTAVRSHPGRDFAQAWQPLVKGSLEEIRVDCEHVQMTGPDALAQIGPALAARLAQQ
jgi:pristinamycin I synthase-3/4